MKSSNKNWLVLGLTIAGTALPVLFHLGANGSSEAVLSTVLTSTAWLALVLYLFAFVARPLNQLLAVGPTRALMRQRRLWGVAFSGVHTVHLALVIWAVYFVLGIGIDALSLAGGGLAYGLMYLMLITSFDGPARALGPKWWRRLHRFGLYWIGLIFAYTLLPMTRSEEVLPIHFVLAALMVLAVAIRLAALVQTRNLKQSMKRSHD